MAFVHESEEKPDLHRFDLDVAEVIDEQEVEGQVFLEDPVFGMVGGVWVRPVFQQGPREVDNSKHE